MYERITVSKTSRHLDSRARKKNWRGKKNEGSQEREKARDTSLLPQSNLVFSLVFP